MFAALCLNAETIPPVGKIDFYGLQSIRPQELRSRLGLKEGDATPVDTAVQLERRLETIPGVVNAKITSVCCDEGKTTVFVGVQEQARPLFNTRPKPTGTVSLPEKVVRSYDQFLATLATEVQRGNADEDDSQGHALYSAKALQPFTDEFTLWANAEIDLLTRVLTNSADSKQRSVAAWVLGYSKDKRAALRELVNAVRDSDETVRNNATRAIGTIAVLARAKPELGLSIDPRVFIDMLQSLSWSDRNKAMMVLLQLAEDHASDVLKELREKALPSLIEMARWQDGHSQMALHLVGRIAGLSGPEIDLAFRQDHREEIIRKALK